jgi:putative transcriptional regulator
MRYLTAGGFIALLVAPCLLGAATLGGTAPRSGIEEPAMASEPAKGVFLIARRELPDPNFRRTVVLLLRHGESGTLGVIVNRDTRISLAEAIPQVEGVEGTRHRLAVGGPVSRDRVSFLLRDQEPVDPGEHVIGDVYFGLDRYLLQRLLKAGKPPGELKVFAGYSSWGAGQLDRELARGDWHLAVLDPGAIFCAGGESLWKKLIDRYDPVGILVSADPFPIPPGAEARPGDRARSG